MKLKAILGTVVLILSMTAFSQATKGKLSYDVFVTSDDAAAAGMLSQTEGSLMELTFMDGKVRTDLFIGQIMTKTAITLQDADTALILIDAMFGRIAMKVTENDMDEEDRLAYENREVELTNETKEIMGYECKKAIVTVGGSDETIIWYSEEIVPNYRKNEYLLKEIPGAPLEMYTTWRNMDMKYVAYEFKEKLKKTDEIFSTEVPEGFTLRTAEEMKSFGQ
ncbi:hypothetical protein [Brumimicrobium mesophilum]|uniref:hypothetical protein n=1 Tax=Brumimicrobium mesophilum TaxID=392717 RepID=UPI000D141610|nr:hypothetical protein [Brumimicrobium mesophilum]